MAEDKIAEERKRIQIQRVCDNSEEVKALKAKIRAANVNKDRTAQIAEFQYRQQIENVSSRRLTLILYRRKMLNSKLKC